MSWLKITANRCLFLGRQVHVVHPALNCGQVFNVIRRRQLALLIVVHERVNGAHSCARRYTFVLCVLTSSSPLSSSDLSTEWMQETVQAAAACHWEADTVLAAASATAVTNYPVIPEELATLYWLHGCSHTCCCLNCRWPVDGGDRSRSDYVGGNSARSWRGREWRLIG